MAELVQGEKRLFEAINRLARLVGDVREVPKGWQPHVDIRLDFERRWLDTEGAGGWTPTTEIYTDYKRAAVGDLPVLQYTRHMYRSLTEEGAPDFVREESADSLKVGSSDPKARWHHEGAGRLPVREVMKKTDEEAREHAHAFRNSYSAIAQADGWRVV